MMFRTFSDSKLQLYVLFYFVFPMAMIIQKNNMIVLWRVDVFNGLHLVNAHGWARKKLRRKLFASELVAIVNAISGRQAANHRKQNRETQGTAREERETTVQPLDERTRRTTG